MDLSMSSTSISALGIPTNPTEPVKNVPKDGEKSDSTEKEVKCIFLGTFFHDSNELNADLIQIKEPTQIKEIRVIPLGAKVNLSAVPQLGATNPSELELEFYFNDLQTPSKSAFTLLQNFSFNDKCRIQLLVDPKEQVITDGLIVRGLYSTVTLAVYGFPVDEVPIKESSGEPMKSETSKDTPVVEESNQDNSLIEDMDLDSPEMQIDTESDTVATEEERLESQPKPIPSLAAPTPEKPHIVEEQPRAIPTITTRVNFDSSFPGGARKPPSYTEEPIDRDLELESDLSSDDQFESKPEPIKSPVKSVSIITPVPAIPVEVDDTEDISDGEVFPEEDFADADEKDTTLNISTTAKLGSPIRDIAQSVSPLSEQDDSLLDDFQEPGVEEIVSDEEMPDFPEFEYGEWEEQWTHIFGSSFNPFSDSFQVHPLRNIKVFQNFGPVAKSQKEMVDLVASKVQEWSKDNFNFDKIETWVQDMEELIPMIPRVYNSENEVPEAVKETVLNWANVGVDLSIAKRQSALPYKTRHIKVGIKLLHALALTRDELIEDFITQRTFEGIEDDKTFQEKLIEIFEEQNMSATMRLSILRALDCMIVTKEGFKAFVDEDNEDSCYNKLLQLSLDKNLGTRVSFSIRSFLKKLKLSEDLSTFEEFVLGIVKNSSSDLSTSVEAQDVDDCVHILETLRDMAKNVDQYLSHPLRILPASSLVELPPTSVAGHDPKIAFIKSLEHYHFVKLCTVLVNNKDLYGRTGGLVSEIISILLEWEAGLVYLCSGSESTTILLKTLAQLEDDCNSVALYACHCLEVVKCIDKLSDGGQESLEDKNEDVRCLQTLVSFLSTQLGRQALSNTLTIGNLIMPLLKSWKSEDYTESSLMKLDRTLRTGYSSKILSFLIRNSENWEFLMKHGAKLHELITTLEGDVDAITGKIREVLPFLTPALHQSVYTLDGIEQLFAIVKSNQENLLRLKSPRYNWGYPPELTTALRLLSAQVVPIATDDVKNCVSADVDDMLIKELKYDVALVKLHSLDAVSAFTAVLQKVMDDFGQPAAQCHALVTQKGDALINVLSPLMRLVRRIISEVVHVRKTEFKDTTVIPVLLKIYSIIECVPVSAPCYRRSREVGQNIVGSLLAYTIPALKQGVETEEELNKSTWTAVISEIIKYIMDEPSAFQTGISIFSELLPLPLPIASKVPLTEAECLENIKLRRLWSAYIHGLSSQIQEMIGILCNSTNSRLITLLKRLCVQLADLSASTCMVVCRAVLDAVVVTMENDLEATQGDSQLATTSSQTSAVKAWLDQSKPPKLLACSGNTARILGFLSSLVNNSGTIKSGMMQALRGVLKLDEKYADLITQFCSILTNSSPTPLPNHSLAQESIVTTFQSLCDQEINIIVPMYGYSGKIYDSKFVLANTLPPKDLFVTICNALINYISGTRYKLQDSRVMEGVLRGLEIISETEYGFYHLRCCIEKSGGLFKNILTTLSEMNLSRPEAFDAVWACISSTTELLRSLTSPRHGSGSNRGSVLTKQEFKNSVEWQAIHKCEDKDSIEDDDDLDKPIGENAHSLVKLSHILSKFMARLKENPTHATIELTEVENTASMLSAILEYVDDDNESAELSLETILPFPDLLQELFSKRPVFVIVEKLGSENLPPFWLTSIPPAFELDSDYSESDLIPCDLTELCQSVFSDFDVVKEVEKLYKSLDSVTAVEKLEASGNSERTKGKPLEILPVTSVLSHLTQHRKPFGGHMRGNIRGGFGRGLMMSGAGRGLDPFRSRPPNTSRPPSLHVDDFVALESSGQSGSVAAAYNKGRGGLDNFNSRGSRGNPRASLLGRPYGDRGRFRAPQPGSTFFGQRMDSQQQSPSRRGSRGGINKPYSDQRWPNESRDTTPSYTRQEHNNRSTYEDKFRSSTPTRSQIPTAGSRNVPYPTRNPYREAPPIARSNNGASNSNTNNNNNSAQRWRDRQRPFNR